MPRRRRFQRGSVKPRKHGRHEVWVGQWRENGKARSKVLGRCSQMTESEAVSALAAILAPFNAGLQASVEWRLDGYIERVFLPLMVRQWKSSTAATSEQRIRQHILPTLGARQLAEISRQELQAFLDDLCPRYTASTVKHLRWDLNQVFRLAVADRLIPSNPAEALMVSSKLCKADKEIRALTETETAQLLSSLPARERLIVRLGVFEGLRAGEIYALQWHDQEGRALTIRRRVYWGKVEPSTKSNKPRTIALSAGTAALLAQWRAQSPEAAADGWIFVSATGKTPLRPENIWRDFVRPTLRTLGLEWLTHHQLRHTNGSLLHAAGADAKTSADQRGHGIGVSLAVYTHSTLKAKQAVVDQLENRILEAADGDEKTKQA